MSVKKRITKKQLKAEIIQMIEAIEQNTFLFPLSWSDKIQMTNYDWEYKTYNSGSVGVNRYHNIEIHEREETVLIIDFRRENTIEVTQDLAKNNITLRQVHFYISAIYEELHTFKNHNEGARKIRKNITKKLAQIRTEKKELAVLRQQLTDLKQL